MIAPTVPLGQLASIFNGKTPSRAEQRLSGHPVLKIKDVDDQGCFIGSFDSFVDDEFARQFKSKSIQQGDLLILNAAHNADYVGTKQYVAESRISGALPTGEWTVFRSNSPTLNQGYLAHWLRAPSTRFKIRRLVKGIHLYPTDCERLEIPIPQLVQQERIVAILDKADAIRRKRRHSLAEVSSLLRATFLDIFGDPAFNPSGFDVAPVQRVLSQERAGTQSGPFGAALKKHEYVSEGIPVWGIDNVEQNNFIPIPRLFVTDEKFSELERYDVRDGDILISRAGTVGRMCIAHPQTERSILSTNLVRVTLNKERMLPEYFVTLFTSFPDRLNRLKANRKENAFSFLNPGTLKAMEIPQPEINLQREFAKCVEKITAVKELHHKGLEGADELFNSLSQRAFQGEL